MDLLSSIFLAISVVLGTYIYISKKKESETVPAMGNEKIKEQEIIRRREAISSVEKFLEKSKFILPIATWKGKSIYKYIFNEGYLYEFDEIMPPNNYSIGKSEQFLCFEQLCYNRVTDPLDFMKNHAVELLNINNKEK